MGKPTPISQQLREAVENADETRASISRATGIPTSNLSDFVHGKRFLSMPSVDKLCEYLGLRLTKNAKTKGR